MAEAITQNEVEDIFGIPKVNRTIQDDSEDNVITGDKTEASTPFETKVEELSTQITKAATSDITEAGTNISSVKEEPKKVQKTGGMFDDIFSDEPEAAPAPVKPVVAAVPKPAPRPVTPPAGPPSEAAILHAISQPLAATATLIAAPIEPKKSPVVMPVPELIGDERKPTVDFDSAPPIDAEKEVKIKPKSTTKKKGGAPELSDIEEDESDEEELPLGEEWTSEDGWRLKSPAPKYNRFYAEKSLALGETGKTILPGGQIDFTKRFKELTELSCDITVQTNDLEGIHQKMQLVQNLRERCKQIQVHTTQQYYLWERYIELFHGILCRIEYVRGKQDGINFEHMSDMEHYFLSLKSLHRASDQVMRTLDGAFECLSRQVTIAMPMKDIERHGSSNPAPRQISPEQKKYDALGATPQSSKPASNAQKGWDL